MAGKTPHRAFGWPSGPLSTLLVSTLGIAFAFFFAGMLPLPAFARADHRQDTRVSIEKVDADRLAREVVQNELKAQVNDKSLWKYRELTQKDGKAELWEIVETRDGEVHRVLALNGRNLEGKKREQEEERLQNIVSHPDQFRERQKDRDHDAEQERKLLEMLPEAFRYQYAGTKDGDIILSFKPNPMFHPKSHESEVFHHMEGTLVVDRRHHRMAALEGTLTSEVKFLGGLLGHLDRGGKFVVRQKDVGGGHWEMTTLDVQMDGKALFFKTIAVREKEIDSDFRQIPETTTLKEAGNFLEVKDRSRAAGF